MNKYAEEKLDDNDTTNSNDEMSKMSLSEIRKIMRLSELQLVTYKYIYNRKTVAEIWCL